MVTFKHCDSPKSFLRVNFQASNLQVIGAQLELFITGLAFQGLLLYADCVRCISAAVYFSFLLEVIFVYNVWYFCDFVRFSNGRSLFFSFQRSPNGKMALLKNQSSFDVVAIYEVTFVSGKHIWNEWSFLLSKFAYYPSTS